MFLILAALAGELIGRGPELRAEAVGFEGDVRNLATGEPIVGAEIRAGDATAVSDGRGHYRLAATPGEYAVSAHADGFIDMERTRQTLAEGAVVELDFDMLPAEATDEEQAAIDAQMVGILQAPEVDEADLAAMEAGIQAVTVVPETIRVLMPDGSVEVMDMDEYLKGVVPSEISPSWPAQALRAQAVAARSYAATRHAHSDQGADVCTTTHCQVWSDVHYATTDAAVEETSGVAAWYNGSVIYAYFHAHCNGHTKNVEDVWSTALPYCVSVACPCGFDEYYGHGVGMCQQGARTLATQGYGYAEILKHYYTGVTVNASPPGVLSNASISATSGDTRTYFTFQVTYESYDGTAPAIAEVIVGGHAYGLARASGDADGPCVYRAATRLPAGTHSYRFVFDDGYGRTAVYPASGATSGPTVTSAAATPAPTPDPVSTDGPRVYRYTAGTSDDWADGTLSGLAVQDSGEGVLALADGETEGTFTSPVFTTATDFVALGLSWVSTVPENGAIDLAVRTSADGAVWGDWQSMPADEDDPGQGNLHSSSLLAVEGATVQYRVTLQAGSEDATPVLKHVELVCIDSSEGPTAAELAASAGTTALAEPTVISRAAWGADESLMTWEPEYRTPQAIIIHHTVTSDGSTPPPDPAAIVRAIYYYHAVEREWGDIGYNYLIDLYGNVYEGRYGGEGVVGGHAKSYNYGSIGVALIGDYQENAVPTLMSTALTNFMAWRCVDYGIDPVASRYFVDQTLPTIMGHRDTAATTCPGDYAYGLMSTWRTTTRTKMAQVVPQITLTGPEAGARVRGVVTMGTASINTTRYELYWQGALCGSADTPPWAIKWNTTAVADGSGTLRIVAINDAGQTSVERQYTVDNTAPVGTVTAPTWSQTTAVPFTFAGSTATRVQFSNGWIWTRSALSQADGVWNNDYTHIWYGPYTCALPADATYDVYYRLKTPDRSDGAGLGIIDVSDNQGWRVYTQRELTGTDFSRDDTYEDLKLQFTYSDPPDSCDDGVSDDGLEFRTWMTDTTSLGLERVAVFGASQAAAASVTWEVNAVEGAQDVTVRLLDEAGNALDRTVTVRVDSHAPRFLDVTGRTARVQDQTSGLDVSSVAWSSSTDGGVTWGAWQALSVSAEQGTTAAVDLTAPEAAGDYVRFKVLDVAGNEAIQGPTHELMLPLVRRY